MAPGPQGQRQSEALTALELVERAAADPHLTPAQAMMALVRLMLHNGVHDPATAAAMGPAVGHTVQGLAKVAGIGDGDGQKAHDEMMAFFNHKPGAK